LHGYFLEHVLQSPELVSYSAMVSTEQCPDPLKQKTLKIFFIYKTRDGT